MTSPLRFIVRFVALVVAVFATTSAMLMPNPLNAAPSPPPAPPHSLPHTDLNPLATNVFLDREVETWKKEETLRLVKEAGIGWIKQMFRWEEIEPAPGVFWNDRTRSSTWEKYDQIVQLARSMNIEIIARLDRPPAWARGGQSTFNGPPQRFEDFGNFVYEVVKRYRGQIRYYQIWNEPNLTGEWNGGNVDPAGYTRLLAIAYRRAKEADPNAVIITAPLAQTLETGPRNLNELEFLRRMYEAGASQYFDILGANAYGFDRPPEDPPDPNVLNFQRVSLLRQIMVEHGDAQKPIWLNEVGWNAPPADFPPQRLIWRRVSEQQQVDYTVRGIELARSWPWVGVIGIWYFRQVGDISATDAAYYFRMVDVDFTPRPLYAAVQAIAARLKIATPGRFEETNPALSTTGAWRSVMTPRASGRSWLESTSPEDSLTITFEGSALAIETRSRSLPGALAVTVDGSHPQPVPLPTGHDEPVQVWVARDLAIGRHAATIQLATGVPADQPFVVDGFIVRADPPSYRPFYFSIAAGVSGIGLLLATLLWRPVTR